MLASVDLVDAKDKRRVLPSDVMDIIERSPRADGQTAYEAPGNRTFDVPPVRPIFDAIRRRIGE